MMELKTLHFGVSTYPNVEQRCEAVARRARALHGEYMAKARAIDAGCCGTPFGVDGPVMRHLLAYGRVRGLVFEAWAEASGDVENLLSVLARTGARARWRAMGCPDETSAIGCLAWLMRRRWGIAALRENARLKLDRLACVGRGAASAALRRQRAEAEYALRARLWRARQWHDRRRR